MEGSPKATKKKKILTTFKRLRVILESKVGCLYFFEKRSLITDRLPTKFDSKTLWKGMSTSAKKLQTAHGQSFTSSGSCKTEKRGELIITSEWALFYRKWQKCKELWGRGVNPYFSTQNKEKILRCMSSSVLVVTCKYVKQTKRPWEV